MPALSCPILKKSQISRLIYLIIFGLTAHSCKNNTTAAASGPDDVNQEKQISRIHYGEDPGGIKWFEYNEAGDLIRQGIAEDTVVFEYSDNKMVKRHLNKKHDWLACIDYKTEQQGRIVHGVRFDENDTKISTCEYLYNPEGYLIKNIETVIASGLKYTNEFFYDSGNLKEIKAYDMSGNLSSRYVFEYYDDKINILNLPVHHIFDDVFPKERMGKKDKNMVRQLLNISKEGDTLSWVTYRYVYDDNALMLKELQSDILNESDTELTYHFNQKK